MSAAHIALLSDDAIMHEVPRRLGRRVGLVLGGLAALALVAVPFVALLFVSWLALLVAVPLSSLVAKLPISIAGVGPQEASLVSQLVAYGVSPEEALALAIPNRSIAEKL